MATSPSPALSRSDVYVFEVPEDAASLAQLNALIQAKGFCPQAGYAAAARQRAADYDAAVSASGPPQSVDHGGPGWPDCN
jgi:hypothetical protein